MLQALRQELIKQLFIAYKKTTPDMLQIEMALQQRGIEQLILDHFALIDLPSVHSGISQLQNIFSTLGYVERGKGYLQSKQNDFLWMCEATSEVQLATDTLAQVVVADFRLDEMPIEIKKIIEKYTQHPQPFAFSELKKYLKRDAKSQCIDLILNYLFHYDWPKPTIQEFYTVSEFNELLAWVLVFGRRPNHFTLSTHLLRHFESLDDFHQFIERDVNLILNQEGGAIKGGKEIGIAQGSTQGILQKIQLKDGEITIPTGFVEFVWRYPIKNNPLKWSDYFTGFIPQHADRVIESLYQA
jgi:hypothetical protein